MGRRQAAATRLEAARAAYAAANARIGKIEAARVDALLADDDNKAVKLDVELEGQRRSLRGYRDKIGLLETEAEREAAAERVRRHEAHIRQVEKLGDDFVTAGTKLAAATAVLVEVYREAIAAAERRGAAWPWAPVDRNGAVLTAQAVHTLLAHEFHRTSRVPFLGGKPGEKAVPSLPGATCSRPTDWLNLPEKETALVDAFKSATQYASRRMRETAAQPDAPAPHAINGNAAAVADEAPPEPQPHDSSRLAALLLRQAELANDVTPQGEAEYQKVVREISTLQ